MNNSLTVQISHTLPAALQVLLPQRHFPIAAAHGKDIPCETPRYTPNNVREFTLCRWHILRRRGGWIKDGLGPRSAGCVLCPDNDRLILWASRPELRHVSLEIPTTHLRCRGYIAPWQPNVWRPGYVTYPVPVTLEGLLFDPCLGTFAE